MAENKNFTMKEYNGTDYDTLYPETNSGQVLLTKTAQDDLGIEPGGGQTSSSPTLDDALSKLGNVIQFDNRYEVGDTLTTSRTNLSDKWLLCNGENLSSSDYPELGGQFQNSLFNFHKIAQQNAFSTDTRCMLAIRETSDKNDALFLTTINSKSDSSTMTIWYCDFSSGSWQTIYQISGYYAYGKVYGLNDIFIRVISGGYAYYCSGNPTDESSWVKMDILDVKDAIYLNNKYYLLTVDKLYIYTSITELPKIVDLTAIFSPHYLYSYSLIGIDGNNIIIGSRDTNDNGNTTKSYINTLDQDGNLLSTIDCLYKIDNNRVCKFGNGYIIACNVAEYSSSGYHNYASVYYQSLNDSSGKTIVAQTDNLAAWIIDDDYVLLSDNRYIDTSLNIKSVGGSTRSLINAEAHSNYNIYVISNKNQLYKSSKSPTFNLPTYSPATGLRAYIKAKN